jgi:hypothetical protein
MGARLARVASLARHGNAVVYIAPSELTGRWRRRGDLFCPPYSIEEHVADVVDAELLLREADGGPHTLRMRLSYLRTQWELLAEEASPRE